MSQTNETYADRVVREAMLAATGGLDPNRVAQAVTDIVEAIAKQAAVLKAATYAPGDYEKISRSMAHAMKTADGVFRLVEFAAGRPDSRPDKGMDWLRALTDEQLRAPKPRRPRVLTAPRMGCPRRADTGAGHDR
jgi:hypothetical protein